MDSRGSNWIVKRLKQLGFTLVSTNKHTKMRSPEGEIIIIAGSASANNNVRHITALVRRMGYELLPPKVGNPRHHR